MRVVLTIVLTYAAVVGLLMIFEKRLIFFPMGESSGPWRIAEARFPGGLRGPSREDCIFQTADGLRLHGWFCRPSADTPVGPAPGTRMTLLWFHGNAGNLSHRFDMILRLLEIPTDVFIFDYRGYGRSEGSPSEQGVYRDADAAWKYLVENRGVRNDTIVLFGKSLGSAIAIDLATRIQPAGLISQSGFSSVPDMAASIFPFIPRFLIRTKMDSAAKAARISCPKLFIHSPADEVVPYRLGRRLFEAAAPPKDWYEIPGASHNETYLVGGQAYLDRLRSFLSTLSPSL